MHKLVSDMRLHCDPDYSSQRVVFALGWRLRHQSLSYIMLRLRLFSRPEHASPDPSPSQAEEKSSPTRV